MEWAETETVCVSGYRVRLTSSLMPVFTVPLYESNDCHAPAGSPAGGQFCSRGAKVVRGLRVPRQRNVKTRSDSYFLLYSGDDRKRYSAVSKLQLAGLDRLYELEDQEKAARKV